MCVCIGVFAAFKSFPLNNQFYINLGKNSNLLQKLTPFIGGMKFAAQVSPLLNYCYLFYSFLDEFVTNELNNFLYNFYGVMKKLTLITDIWK
jgi:hypothetical protein